MRRISIWALGFAIIAGTAYAQFFNPSGSFGQTYAVLADMLGNVYGAGNPFPVGTTSAPLTSVANQQTITLSGTVQFLSVPTGAKYADLFPEGMAGTNNQCLRYRDDGADPTATVGAGLAAQQDLFGYSGNLAAIRFINATGAACTLTINYYK